VNEVAEWADNHEAGGAHSTYNSTYGSEGCFCHQINTTSLAAFGVNLTAINASGFNYSHWNESGDVSASNWYWRPTTTPHAAVIIDCVDCHWNESQQIQNTASAHYAFWNETKNSANSANNTACMACHTHTHLNITWIRLSGLTIIANHTDATAEPYNAWNLTVETGPFNTTHTNTTSYGS
jgi:hypothetical protein